MSIAFSRPEYLLLLPVAAALLWVSARGSYAGLRRARLWIAWILRGLLTLALILALAGLQLVEPSDEMVVVFALDGSHSIAPAQKQRSLAFIQEAMQGARAEDRGALVVFGKDAVVESERLRRGAAVQTTSSPVATHTDIAGALRLAMGLLPPKAAGKVVLLTDGNENVGAADQEVLLARSRRVAVDVVPLETRATKDTIVLQVTTPSDVYRSEQFDVRVAIASTDPRESTITLTVDDEPVLRQKMTLAAGETSLQIPVGVEEPGFHRVDVLVEAAGEQFRENDIGTSFVRVMGKPQILLVDSEPEAAASIAKALDVQDIGVHTGGPMMLPTSLADLERYDSVFLSNLPAYKMDSHQMVMLRDATRDLGVGLGMIGGEFSFGAGGYYDTPVEEALPVSMDITKNRIFPASAVVIVIDRSGSMGMIEDGVEKIQLAGEAAASVVDLLQPYDSIGVFAVDTEPTEVCRLRKVGNKTSVKNDIRGLRAGGGGIYCYTGLAAAHDALRTNNSAIRHIILLADAVDSEQQEGSIALVKSMYARKITTTAIAIGDASGCDVPYLQSVAKAGHGQFYVADSARDLKKIFTRETLTVAKSALVEEPFQVRRRDRSPVTAGIPWSSSPALLGYVATAPKDLANIALVSHKDDPVFAHWQYGLGRSVAFTSDARPRWAAGWLGWNAFPKFWGQVIRWSLRQQSTGTLHPRVEQSGDQARLVVDAVDSDGALLNGLEMRGAVNLPDGSREEIALAQTGPGRYEGTAPTPAIGPYVVGLNATGPDGFEDHRTVGFAVAYPPDFADTQPNPRLLTRLAEQTGGAVLETAENVFVRPEIAPRTSQDVWRLLLWLAAILLPLDVAVRRLVITREDLAAFTQPVAALMGSFRVSRPETRRTRTLDRLMTRKDAGRTVPGDEELAHVPLPDIRPGDVPPGPEGTAPPVDQQPAAEPAQEQPDDAKTTTSRLLERKRRLREEADED